MTFKEKLKEEHPDCFHSLGSPVGCPNYYGYESLEDSLRACTDHTCKECWNREIPGTEKSNNEINENKENNTMATTRKTKDELLKELKEANEKIGDLKKELKDLERYKQYDECASEMAAMRDSFVKAGFSEEEAFALLQQMIVDDR